MYKTFDYLLLSPYYLPLIGVKKYIKCVLHGDSSIIISKTPINVHLINVRFPSLAEKLIKWIAEMIDSFYKRYSLANTHPPFSHRPPALHGWSTVERRGFSWKCLFFPISIFSLFIRKLFGGSWYVWDSKRFRESPVIDIVESVRWGTDAKGDVRR